MGVRMLAPVMSVVSVASVASVASSAPSRAAPAHAAGTPPAPAYPRCSFLEAYPPQYAARYTKRPIAIDGEVEADEAWREVPFTMPFVDITGNKSEVPRLSTRAKMRWDEHFLYVAAELEEPHVCANVTKHDEVIFQDNDFEVFVDASSSTHNYKEFEMNALGTTWDLALAKPYLNGGGENSSRVDSPGFDMESLGMRAAATTDGIVNRADVPSTRWFAEVRLPFSGLACNTTREVAAPVPGELWRINFSRVEWRTVRHGSAYWKWPVRQAESNWVWTPMGVVDMHLPERWGYVQFLLDDGSTPTRDADWSLRYMARSLYDAQTAYRTAYGKFADNAARLLPFTADPRTLDGACFSSLTITAAPAEFSARLALGSRAVCVSSDRLTAVGPRSLACPLPSLRPPPPPSSLPCP